MRLEGAKTEKQQKCTKNKFTNTVNVYVQNTIHIWIEISDSPCNEQHYPPTPTWAAAEALASTIAERGEELSETRGRGTALGITQ